MSGLTCDICGKKDYNAGVCNSSLGAISFSYCTVCLAMGAEQQGLAKDMFPSAESTYMKIAYYKNDSYYNIHTEELIPIKLENGKEFNTRQEVINHWESLKKRN